MKFLNKLYNKLIFSDAPNLNITAFDMGEGQCTIKLNKRSVNRIPTATGTVGSLEIFVPVEITVEVLKTSPVIKYYRERYFKNGYIGGSLTLYDDTNEEYSCEEVSMALDEFPQTNGTQASVNFILEGNLRVNMEALAGFI